MIENLEKKIHMKGIRKTAMLLVVLGDQTSAEILRLMEEEEVQEIGREINTTGSKAYDSDIQKCVVLMKDELEKAKEQIFNVL